MNQTRQIAKGPKLHRAGVYFFSFLLAVLLIWLGRFVLGDIDAIRRMIVQECQIPIGTVPIYQAAIARASRDAIVNMTEDDMFNGVVAHAKDGVDFMTIHCGVTRQSVEKLMASNRLTGVVSRGGAFLTAWILHNDQENPFFSNFETPAFSNHLKDIADVGVFL